jgi:hypothetical protein
MYRICGSHSGGYEEFFCLLGNNTVYAVEILVLRRCDGGDVFPRNVG